MVWIALTAAVSRMYIWVRLYLGTAIVMMIRMIAITIKSSMRENPRRSLRLCIGDTLIVRRSSALWRGMNLIREPRLLTPGARPLSGGLRHSPVVLQDA